MTECVPVTGAELRKLRERAGLTQADLAARADVVPITIIRWETGQRPIPVLAALGLKVILAAKPRK
jgi:transcriptional regulator with XRE-family HTH domain